MQRCAIAVLLALPASSISAQSGNDAARTVIGFSFGVLPGGQLWEVANQPINPISTPPTKDGTTPSPYPPDVWDIRRDLVTRRPAIEIHATRFVNPQLGVSIQLGYYGIKVSDACTVVQHGTATNPGDPELRAVCDSIPASSQGSQTSTAIQAGMVFRPFAHSVLQPFVEASVGVGTSAGSTAELQSTYAHLDGGEASMTIFHDANRSSVAPTWTIGAGFATAMTQGLLARVAFRESWLAQSIVTGPSAGQGTEASIQRRFRGFFNVLVGVEVVLVKERGHRY